jgi:protein TonB
MHVQGQRMTSAVAVSCAYHLAAIVAVLISIRSSPHLVTDVNAVAEHLRDGVVWVAEAAPGGGGGNRGNRMNAPPRPVVMPGHDAITVPVARATRVDPSSPDRNLPEPDPVQRLAIPAEPRASGVESLAGVMASFSSDPLPLGPDCCGKGGTGDGDGDGPGHGSGSGPGHRIGTGGGPGGLGGIDAPRVMTIVKPQYTTAAMSARIQGVVLVSCIVQPDGSVADARVVRSLDRAFGLDDEAIKAARQWKFLPGTRLGKPVPVRVSIEVAFTLR